jgi:hypothetical protein
MTELADEASSERLLCRLFCHCGKKMHHPGSKKGAAVWLLALLSWVPLAAWGSPDYQLRVEQVLSGTPLIDGHNDLPWEIRDRFKSDLAAFDLKSDTAHLPFPAGESPLMTDIPRLRAGHVGGQFWSVWVPTEMKGFEAVQVTLEHGSGQAHGRALSRRL